MRNFIKIEKFNNKALKLTFSERKKYIEKHKEWIIKLKTKGIKINSGYLVDSNQIPGAGGLLIIKTISYEKAMEIIKKDPMITNKLVTWELNEWIPI